VQRTGLLVAPNVMKEFTVNIFDAMCAVINRPAANANRWAASSQQKEFYYG